MLARKLRDAARYLPVESARILGTVVLHGRFPPGMGARIPGALDVAMAVHEAEQPAAGWDDEGLAPEDVPRGTSRKPASSAGAVNGAGARESSNSQ